jgi:hypothetical protein
VRGPSAYRRGVPRYAPTGSAFLIVTEGEKTELKYLHAVRERLRLAATDIQIIHPEGTDPITLTKFAIERRELRKQAARRGHGFVVPYDEVWVVFDLERPHSDRRRLAREAKNLKGASGINFACSDLCFEFWLILHYEYTTAPYLNCEKILERLRRHWPGYQKNCEMPSALLDKLPIAVRHAARCRQHHIEARGDGNPSSDLDLLLRRLNLAARPPLRYVFPD